MEVRSARTCPFVGGACTKRLGRSGLVSGACTVKPATSGPVICCPNRMYANEYRILLDVAIDAFGPKVRLCRSKGQLMRDGKDVVVFGKKWGKELRLPSRRAKGGYFVDWVLALIDPSGNLSEFVAVEVQTMDTTGSYEATVRTLYEGGLEPEPSKAGINWENVKKRILPQIIYKGHVIRLERLCKKGLYFICPEPVYLRIAAPGRKPHELPSAARSFDIHVVRPWPKPEGRRIFWSCALREAYYHRGPSGACFHLTTQPS